MTSLPPCLPLDCSQMRTGRTAARDPHPGGFVSARDTLGWISSVNCSVAVSTCPAYDTAGELLMVMTQTRTSLYVVVVLTLVATIFTDTASIVDQADLLFVVILVRDSSSFSLLLLWPCKFKSSSPRPHREHSRLAASTAATLSRLHQSSVFCASIGAFGLCSILFFVSPSKFSVTLNVNCPKDLTLSNSLLNAGQAVDLLVVIVVCL